MVADGPRRRRGRGLCSIPTDMATRRAVRGRLGGDRTGGRRCPRDLSRPIGNRDSTPRRLFSSLAGVLYLVDIRALVGQEKSRRALASADPSVCEGGAFVMSWPFRTRRSRQRIVGQCIMHLAFGKEVRLNGSLPRRSGRSLSWLADATGATAIRPAAIRSTRAGGFERRDERHLRNRPCDYRDEATQRGRIMWFSKGSCGSRNSISLHRESRSSLMRRPGRVSVGITAARSIHASSAATAFASAAPSTART